MPNMCEQISVLMAVYKNDKPEYLDLALESIFNQTLKASNVVLVEDGPLADDLKLIIVKWQKIEDSLTVISYKENRGLAYALNTGLEAIKTKYIARMDADDICVQNRFEMQFNFMENNPDIDVVGSYIEEIDENNNTIKNEVKYPITHQECYRFFEKRDPLAHPSVMFRNTYFKKINGFYDVKKRKNQDTRLWHMGFMNGCIFANIPEKLLKFRRTSELILRRSNFNNALMLLKEHIQKNKDLNYGINADFNSFLYFFFTQLPGWVKKLAYQYLR